MRLWMRVTGLFRAVLDHGKVQVGPCQWVGDEVSQDTLLDPAEHQILHDDAGQCSGNGLTVQAQACGGPRIYLLTHASVQVNVLHQVSVARLPEAVIMALISWECCEYYMRSEMWSADHSTWHKIST